MTTAQAARLLGVSAQTIQKWVDANHLSAWRTVGGHRRISAESVQQMLRRRQAGRGSGAALVYVVDDDDLARSVLQGQLARLLPDARIQGFSSGFSALVQVGRERPDLLIADVDMPGMDGPTMLSHLRADASTRSVQVVLVSGHDAAGLSRFAPLPADQRLLRKPVDDETLLGAVAPSLLAAASTA